jgi:hypothetical protein
MAGKNHGKLGVGFTRIYPALGGWADARSRGPGRIPRWLREPVNPLDFVCRNWILLREPPDFVGRNWGFQEWNFENAEEILNVKQ